jgi:hypothetical protein
MASAINTIVSSAPVSVASAGGCRLDSWKEIAVYLSREVRTVQRWEKREGMLVHRHGHSKGNTVYAFREEIDAWLIGRRKVFDSWEPQRCLFC